MVSTTMEFVLTDGEGDTNTLQLLEALAMTGLKVGGFADNDGTSPTKWSRVEEQLGKLLFRWSSGCLEENVIRLCPTDLVEELIRDPNDELTGERLRTLARRLSLTKKTFPQSSLTLTIPLP